MSRRRPVACLETGKRYASVAEAARAMGRSNSPMRRAIDDGTTCGGLHFYFADAPKPPRSFFEHPMPKTARPVVCVSTGERFESVGKAAERYGLRSIWVSDSATRKTPVKGLEFRYVRVRKKRKAR